MTNIDHPIAMTLAVKTAMLTDDTFADWAIDCLHRHRDGDWGEVGWLTWQGNNDDPETALSTYRVPDEHSHHLPVGLTDEALWIVNDGLITTMLWPTEY